MKIYLAEIYVQSRGDLLTYLDEVAQHGRDVIFKEWFEHELLNLLTPEQKILIKERLKKDSLGVSDELIEKLGE